LTRAFWVVGRGMSLVVHPVIVLLIVVPFVIAAIAALIRHCRK